MGDSYLLKNINVINQPIIPLKLKPALNLKS